MPRSWCPHIQIEVIVDRRDVLHSQCAEPDVGAAKEGRGHTAEVAFKLWMRVEETWSGRASAPPGQEKLTLRTFGVALGGFQASKIDASSPLFLFVVFFV